MTSRPHFDNQRGKARLGAGIGGRRWVGRQLCRRTDSGRLCGSRRLKTNHYYRVCQRTHANQVDFLRFLAVFDLDNDEIRVNLVGYSHVFSTCYPQGVSRNNGNKLFVYKCLRVIRR